MAGQTYEEAMIYADKLEDIGWDTRLLRAWLTTIERRPPSTQMYNILRPTGRRQDGDGANGDTFGGGDGYGLSGTNGGFLEFDGDGVDGYSDGGGGDD